jgi:hypothetical protein
MTPRSLRPSPFRGVVIVLAGLLGTACASTGDKASNADDDVTRRRVDLASVVDRAQCAQGNSEHEVASFDPKRFDAVAVMAEIKNADSERGCPGRIYSKSKEDGVETFVRFVKEQQVGLSSSCENEEDPQAWPKLEADLLALVKDPTNLAVYSSLHDPDGSDDPVHCAIFRFYVLRSDGTRANFDFDWSD